MRKRMVRKCSAMSRPVECAIPLVPPERPDRHSAALFTFGKSLIGLYIGRMALDSTYRGGTESSDRSSRFLGRGFLAETGDAHSDDQ
jgi:hypothetical protein